MAVWLVSLVAVGSTGVCICLWFREVRRIMRERHSTVESAAGQLRSCRERAGKVPNDPEAAAVLARSEAICRQAVELYNRTLCKPWYALPARIMGFRPIPEGGLL